MSLRPPSRQRARLPGGIVSFRGGLHDGFGRDAAAQLPVGGLAIGTAGAVGSIYENFTLSWGDEFSSLNLATPQNPRGRYATTRNYRGTGTNSPGAGLRAPPAGPLAVMHDIDPSYTGWQDARRGAAPVATDTHTIQTEGGATFLRLKARRQTAGEQTQLATGIATQVELGAMIHSALAIVANSPAIFECRMRLRRPTGAARGSHPTFWTQAASPPGGGDFSGIETGFESTSVSTQAYSNSWPGASAVANTGSTLGGVGGSPLWADQDWHLLTIRQNATNATFYIDNVLVWTSAQDPDANGNKTNQLLFTNHVYETAFLTESYVASDWAGGGTVEMDLDWARVWRQSSAAHYRPLTTIADTLVAHGGSVSIVLPAQTALWGATGLTEYVSAMPVEVEEPGGSNSTAYQQFPSGLSYNSGTRTLSGTMPAGAGALYITVHVTGDGISCEPAVFRIVQGPRWVGASSPTWPTGVAITPLDVYAGWDVGRLFRLGDADPKRLTCSGLPAGLSFSATTGLITGTPSTPGTGTIVLGCTNLEGQSATFNLSYTVGAPSSFAFEGLASIRGYFTADENVTGTSTVTAWGNKVSGGASYAGASGTEPALVTNSQNGLPGIQFTRTGTGSTTDRLEIPDTAAAINTMVNGSDPVFTQLLIIRPTDTNTGLAAGWSRTVSISEAMQIGLVRRNGTASSFRKSPLIAETNDVNIVGNLASGTTYLMVKRSNGTTCDIWVNSTTKNVTAAAQDPTAAFASMVKGLGVLRTSGPSDPTWPATAGSQIVFAEAVFNAALSDSDISAMITDLATKWGITLS